MFRNHPPLSPASAPRFLAFNGASQPPPLKTSDSAKQAEVELCITRAVLLPGSSHNRIAASHSPLPPQIELYSHVTVFSTLVEQLKSWGWKCGAQGREPPLCVA